MDSLMMRQSCQQQPPQQVELINRVPGMQEPAAFQHNFGQNIIINSNTNTSSSSSSLASSAGNIINGNNSVIVHPPRLATMPANVQMVEEGNSSMAKTKRALNPEGEKQPEQQLMEPTQTKMAKMESVARSLTPEVLGVHRFISPFSAEAKIPLPHELNELSAHGTTVWKRNERERQRVRCVNEGYVQLRSQLPLTEYDRRLSKVDTLRLAIAYIRHLEQLITVGQARHQDCQCFANYNCSGGEGSSAENTPPPN